MLDQFRHDMNTDSHDALQDSRFQTSRRKFVYTLSGAALALVLFLFLIGAFRSEKNENQLLVSGSEPSANNNTLQDLQTRVTKLEELVAKLSTSSSLVAQATELQNDLQTSLNDDTLKQLIEQQQTLEQIPYPLPDVANPNPTDGSTIEPTPTPKPTPKALSQQGRTYVVQKGDTLSKISQRFYGSTKRWKDIYDANRDRISNINQLKVGTKIVIPDEQK
jgi:LysM repeat protein